MRVCLAVLMITTAMNASAFGQNFRVTTEIADDKDEVIGQSNTLFYQGRVFDVSDPNGQEFTVFDPTQNRIRMINLKRKVQTQIATSTVEKFTAETKLREMKVKRPYEIDPNFEDESTDKLIRLTSPHLSYEAETTSARFSQAVSEYLRFADWMCQLNAMQHVKTFPPFSRMKLNQQLSERGELPLVIRRRLGEQKISSKHRYYWVLSRQDRELCERIGGYLADPKIEIVTLKDYRAGAARVAVRNR